MSTVAEIQAEVVALQSLVDDQSTKSDASHAAAANVATVTSAQQALVDQATAEMTVAVNEAQDEADAAKALTDAATEALDAAVAKLIADVQTLAK